MGSESAMVDCSSCDGPMGVVNDLHKSSTAKLSVPVVDLADRDHAKKAIAAACTDWGFFQVGRNLLVFQFHNLHRLRFWFLLICGGIYQR